MYASERLLMSLAFVSGAFSNVYKAIDRRNNTKVAIKCVRKFELNSNQVRNILHKRSFMFRYLRRLDQLSLATRNGDRSRPSACCRCPSARLTPPLPLGSAVVDCKWLTRLRLPRSPSSVPASFALPLSSRPACRIVLAFDREATSISEKRSRSSHARPRSVSFSNTLSLLFAFSSDATASTCLFVQIF